MLDVVVVLDVVDVEVLEVEDVVLVDEVEEVVLEEDEVVDSCGRVDDVVLGSVGEVSGTVVDVVVGGDAWSSAVAAAIPMPTPPPASRSASAISQTRAALMRWPSS